VLGCVKIVHMVVLLTFPIYIYIYIYNIALPCVPGPLIVDEKYIQDVEMRGSD
jgi:hypothetical protein